MRQRWELFVTSLLLLTLIVTPWNLAFVEEDTTSLIVAESFVDGVFFIDLILNFMFAFYDSNLELVYEPKIIRKTYIKSWIIVDLLATMPISLILDTSGGFGLGSSLAKTSKVLKMTRMLRIFKVIKERAKLAKYLREIVSISVTSERMFFFMLIFLTLVHICSCLWVFTAKYDESIENWIS